MGCKTITLDKKTNYLIITHNCDFFRTVERNKIIMYSGSPFGSKYELCFDYIRLINCSAGPTSIIARCL